MTSESAPLISVVIPSYNHGRLIGRALASVLAQTYASIEVLVVDNHSSDNTAEVLAGFQDPRIRLLSIRNNGVIAASRNMGVCAARGEWIAFLDSDDWWAADKLERCSSWFECSDLVYHRLQVVDPGARSSRRRVIKSWQLKAPVLTHLLVSGNAIATSSVVVRKHVLDQVGGFDERPEIVAAEDYNAWLHIAQTTDRFKFVPDVLGQYLFNPHSASRKDMSVPVRIVCSQFTALLDARQLKQMHANASYAGGRFAYSHGHWERAAAELWTSLRWGRVDMQWKSLLTLGLIWWKKFRAAR